MNNRMSKKLRNSRGVSMIIAMIFMLLCLFVGGTVLTAATVNSGRIKHAPKRQVFINHRSAAMLVADELKTSDDENLQLRIVLEKVEKQPVKVMKNGFMTANGAPVTNHITHFVASHDMDHVTAFQRIVIETAVRCYQSEKGLASVSIEYRKADGSMGVIPENQFWIAKPAAGQKLVSNTVHVNGTWVKNGAGSEEALNDFDAVCYCDHGRRPFDFVVDFDELSTVKVGADVKLDASTDRRIIPPVVEVFHDGNFTNGFAAGNKYTTSKTEVIVSWPGPRIVKGGNV